MSNAFSQAFADFTREKLRPAIDLIPVRKRSGLLIALLSGVVMFLVFAVIVYFLMQPYKKMLEEHGNISIWPLILLTPLALAMIAFTLVYILNLRSMVKEFRATLIARMTEFIDPGLAHDARSPIPAGELEASLLFENVGAAVAGTDRFRGRSGAAVVELRDMHVPTPKSGGEKSNSLLTGVFMKATYEKSFREPLFVFPMTTEISRGGLEQELAKKGVAIKEGLVRVEDTSSGRQVVKPSEAEEWGRGFLPRGIGEELEALRRESGAELYLSCWDHTLYAALLSRNERIELPGAFDNFDFGNCREFCRKATLAMALARELGSHPDLWRAEQA